ncbi:YrhB domain-containing protein [Ferruginibacter albus]|uniref:YrhB domain-containing protein n=1 Tax=Ferruginibacter albus TaxID=2875540 RepID=UPI001CC70194|nr:YrhB domain-containing protein [Ferruginibacter albus]UAY52787.1 YrhB family protein [Ferruginibacter albus]
MLTLLQAKELADKKLKEIEEISNIKLAFLENETIAFEYGWIFFYQSESYINSGDFNFMAGGNAPILVDKYNSNVIETGTSRETKYYIEQYCNAKQGIK